MASKKTASFYTKANLAAKPKSVGKSKISFDFEQQFSVTKQPKAKDLEFIYRAYPLAFEGVNLIADECIARGFEIIHESEEVRKEMDEWMDDVNFKEKIYDVIVNTLVFGNGYFEIVFDEDGDTIDEIVVMDPVVVDFLRDNEKSIIFDPSGNPKGYVQTTGAIIKDDDIRFSPDEIAHFIFYTLRGQRTGISLLSSVARNITHAMNTDNAIAQAIFRHGFAQFDVSVGSDTRRPTEDEINKIATDVEDLQVTNEYVHSDDIKVEILEAKNTRSYDKYNEIFISNIVSGMGIPAPLLLGSGESSNKSTATVQSRHFRSMIETIQGRVQAIVEDKIFDKLAELRGWTETPILEWNEVLPEEESAKVARIASLFEQGIITRTEAREMAGLPAQIDFGDLKPSAVTIPPQFPPQGGEPGQAPGERPLPEKTGPRPQNEPRAPEKSVVPPFNRDQPSEKGRGSLKDNKELNSLKGDFTEALNHYFDSLRSSTLNKVVSFNELSDEKSTAIPLERISKELTRDHKELGSLLYIFMKEATKMGLKESGVLKENELALLSVGDAEYLDGYVDMLAKKEMDDIFNKVNWLVLDSFAKHESIGEITDKINSVFFKFTSYGQENPKQVKADLIAGDNVNRGFNNGLLVGFTKNKVEFVGRACIECESCDKCNTGEFDKLSVGDARGKFPIHPNCTCTFTSA